MRAKVGTSVRALAVVAVGATLAGSAGGALAAGRSAPAGTPAGGPTVKPSHFAGDIRRIPRGNVVPREDQPGPRSPDGSPAGALKADAAVQTVSASAAAPGPSAS